MVAPPKALLVAFVLADHVYIDGKTGKKVIAGTFNHFAADDFPAEMARGKFAFLSLTDVRGRFEVTLRFVDLAGNDTLVELRGLAVECDDPLETVELVVEIPRLPIPHAGVYALEAHAQGEMMGMLRLHASQRPQDED